MDQNSEQSNKEDIYNYGDEVKSGMIHAGSRRAIPKPEYRKGDEVQMEVGEKGRKTWVRFTIRKEPRRNPRNFWEYQLNYKKNGAQFSEDKYFPESGILWG